MHGYRFILALSAIVAGLAACATSPRAVSQTASGDVATPESEAVSVVVRNDNYSDLDVYAIANGERTRLGMVTGNHTSRFRLAPNITSAGQVQIVASPIGGRGAASTGMVNVIKGQTIHFTVAPVLSQSSVEVR
jgi:hypothetical protein